MKTYDKYKDSGIEWIGDVPEHWEVKKLKHCISINDDALNEITDEDAEINYVEIGDVNYLTGINNFTTYKFKDAPSRARRVVQNGDIIVSTVRTYLKSIARIKETNNNLIVSTGFAVLRPRNIHSSYLGYFVLTPFFIHKTIADSVGVSYPAINSSNIGLFECVIPSIEEQTIIATYLDRKTTEIDRIIANKQKLIALYEEEKQAIINQAVTKGLDRDVQLKDSGVEWLGEIPEHWDVKKLKYVLSSIVGGGTPATANSLYWDGEIPWVSAKDMKQDYIYKSEDYITELGVNESSTTFFKDERVIIVVRSGILKHTLPVAINKVPISINQDLKALKPIKTVSNAFLFWKLKGLSNEILTYCNKMGATVDSLDMSNLMDLPFGFPTIGEQHSIIAHIEKECARLDTIIEKFNKQIELLQEYRTTLISEVVTGKVKVTD